MYRNEIYLFLSVKRISSALLCILIQRIFGYTIFILNLVSQRDNGNAMVIQDMLFLILMAE
ncbi:hypothetical protein BHC57_00565 [Snodgrassella alvi]|uniref:Uncharacterized protein n=1 Tax=Snodgrassella alvi TaxID=1196083 RepID=A0A855FZY0_9NEIS|nr:hypothetical protein BHC57_00565 [Snodgrassella alvi]